MWVAIVVLSTNENDGETKEGEGNARVVEQEISARQWVFLVCQFVKYDKISAGN